MSCAYLFAANPSAQALTSGAQVNFGSAAHGFDPRGWNPCPSHLIALNGTTINLNQCGYYDVEISGVVTDSEAGDVTITLYQDGQPVSGATSSEAIAAAADPASVAISAGIVVPHCSKSALTLVVTTTAGTPTVNNIAVTVTKVK